LPSHFRAGWSFLFESTHLGFSQTVFTSHFLQTPRVPEHFPSRPHVALSSTSHLPLGSENPAATAEQVPAFPARLHFSQAWSHFSLQHTPSVQKPLAQSASAEHVFPAASLQAPDVCPTGITHSDPGAQSPEFLHETRHNFVAASQRYGEHAVWEAAAQVPCPSHFLWP
jgi:hypothetical protein